MPLPSEEVTPPVTKMYLVEPVIAFGTCRNWPGDHGV
jgi:hypothetical protein